MQDISQHWQTWLIAWMVLGDVWLIRQLATARALSRNEFWATVAILILGPVSTVLYLASYLFVMGKGAMRK